MSDSPDDLDPRVLAAHNRADDAQKDGYIDHLTGYFVMTAGSLRRRGQCCGNGCRHCPYTLESGAIGRSRGCRSER